MPHFPPDVHAYAHPEKTRHLQIEVTQASQSQLSTSPFYLISWTRSVESPQSSPSFTALPASSNDQVLPNLPQQPTLPPAEPTAEIFLQDRHILIDPSGASLSPPPTHFPTIGFLKKCKFSSHPSLKPLPPGLRFEFWPLWQSWATDLGQVTSSKFSFF